MKLAICTDVFADLSYTDMLDKVKSLGIDAVEMTAGGWVPASTATPRSCLLMKASARNSWASSRSAACVFLH